MPVWNRTIRLGDLVSAYKEHGNIPRLAELVAARIEKSGWLEDTPYPDTLRDHLDRLKQATSRGEYEYAFDYIYDDADEDRVWIETS